MSYLYYYRVDEGIWDNTRDSRSVLKVTVKAQCKWAKLKVAKAQYKWLKLEGAVKTQQESIKSKYLAAPASNLSNNLIVNNQKRQICSSHICHCFLDGFSGFSVQMYYVVWCSNETKQILLLSQLSQNKQLQLNQGGNNNITPTSTYYALAF